MKIGRQRGKHGSIKIRGAWSTKISFIMRIVLIVLVVVGFFWSQSNYLYVRNHIYESSKIPKSFVGTKVMHISDLYNNPMGVESAVKKFDPDIVIIAGNLSDSNGESNKSVKLINELASDYKTYYVLGETDVSGESLKSQINAECLEGRRVSLNAPSINYDDFVKEYVGDEWTERANNGNESAIKYLQYTKDKLSETSNAVIEISGLPLIKEDVPYLDQAYSVLNYDKELFQILTFNQSQHFENMSKADVDLILAGNPVKIGLTGKYSAGMYSANSTSMLVTNGTGKHDEAPTRFVNWPSIYALTLSDGTIDSGNPLEKIIGKYIYDVETRFDNDEGFKNHTYVYENTED